MGEHSDPNDAPRSDAPRDAPRSDLSPNQGSTAAPRRPTAPSWLLAGLRPSSAPIPWAAVARASVGMAVPLAVGFAVDQPAYGALASMGALYGVIGDTADAYRMRIFHIAVPQLFGAVGVTLGALVFDRGWWAVGVLTLLALVSGMMSSIGAVASSSGLQLLLFSVLGAGLAMPEPWWVAPLLFLLGGLFVLLLSLLAWPLRGMEPERAAVAGTYRAVADLLAAAGRQGTGGLPGPERDTYDTRRQAVTDSLNEAYDLVLARRAREHGRSEPLVRLLAQLNVVIPLVEAAPAAHLHGRPLPAAVPDAVRKLADAVAEGRTDSATEPDRPPRPGATSAERAVDAALRHATSVVHHSEPDPHNVDDRLGRPAALRVRARRATRDVLLSEDSWRYGLRLALCIGLSQALVSLVPVPRSYWVALTVTFILKPDYGSVFSRAVLRALGTVAGLVVAAAILSHVARGWWDVAVMLVIAGIVPAMTAKGYAFQTAAITPVILLLSDLLSHEGSGLLLPRFVDSMMGCAIALIAGYLLWPESWHTRIGDRLADAVEETAEYVRCAFAPTPDADRSERVRTRRRIYRDLSVVRTEFQRALTEPPPTGTRARAWWPLLVAVERVVDATTAARVRVDHGAPPPAPAEIAAIERQLRELADGMRSSAVLVEVRAELGGDEEGVLAPLRQEVRGARAIASPQRRTGLTGRPTPPPA
ncbi:FUSC family protein [Streptomyces sp. JV176]|uniref:FUSC family protein n=1 Tax=Streptomyces sp. JV176 TaxID=858630 RepID=UPI002E784EAD|nr:FUSC family protein [Streptomyces sp. JV176]MEE1800024.1 FUSC family protein [Streptomyces sp. JV176]